MCLRSFTWFGFTTSTGAVHVTEVLPQEIFQTRCMISCQCRDQVFDAPVLPATFSRAHSYLMCELSACLCVSFRKRAKPAMGMAVRREPPLGQD